MYNNLSLSKNKQYKTHFIYLNKNEINNLDDIKRLTNLDIDINNTIIINNNSIKNIDIKNIGDIIPSNGEFNCDICYKSIINKCKKLNCDHKFHIKCINNILYKDYYKKCPICITENISNLLS